MNRSSLNHLGDIPHPYIHRTLVLFDLGRTTETEEHKDMVLARTHTQIL